MSNFEHAIDVITRAEEELIYIAEDLPVKYFKKLDTITGKLENLKWDLINSKN